MTVISFYSHQWGCREAQSVVDASVQLLVPDQRVHEKGELTTGPADSPMSFSLTYETKSSNFLTNFLKIALTVPD